MTEATFRIRGMHCAGCVATLERGIGNLPGVAEVQVNLATGSARVAFDGAKLSEPTVVETITQLGYNAEPGEPDIVGDAANELRRLRLDAVVAVTLALLLMVVAMGPMIHGGSLFSVEVDSIVQAFLAAIILFGSGRRILADAANQTRHRAANMNSLVALGTVAAFLWSVYAAFVARPPLFDQLYFESAGMIIALVLLGRFFEARARWRAGDSLRSLVSLRPSKALAVINDVEIEIDSDTIQPGMDLIVKSGERLAADGRIRDGEPSLDESLVTGESSPQDKRSGDDVIGGSLNVGQPFRMTVTRPASDSFLAEVLRQVAAAQAAKVPIQRLADRVAGIFVPIVIGIAVITGVTWAIVAPGSPLLVNCVVAVLIIACPCALGLATPTAILVATGRAAREGMIIRSGDLLERLTAISTIALDKTGTLTRGQHAVSEFVSYDPYTLKTVLQLVGALESRSEHPLGRAIFEYCQIQQPTVASSERVTIHPGGGLSGTVDNRQVVIGSRALMVEHDVDVSAAGEFASDQTARGRSVVFVAVDGALAASVSLSDHLRTDAREAVRSLRERFQLILFSGDNRRTVGAAARSLGIDAYEAELKPGQKRDAVEVLQRAGETVAMVGDGINDAPALTQADVGIAIGSGTDVAAQSAGVVLVGSELVTLRKLFELSDMTLRTIRQNLGWAFGYNLLALPIAAGVFYPLFAWTLTPMIAAVAMSLSSLFVVLNSLRLARLELSPKLDT